MATAFLRSQTLPARQDAPLVGIAGNVGWGHLKLIITHGVNFWLHGPTQQVRIPAGTGLAPGVRASRRTDAGRVHGAHAAGVASLRGHDVSSALRGLCGLPVATSSGGAVSSRPEPGA